MSEMMQKFTIATENGPESVDAHEIDWAEERDGKTFLHVGTNEYVVRRTLNQLEADLDPTWFLRCDDSVLVNVDRMYVLEPQFHGNYTITLRDGTNLPLSSRYWPRFERRIKSW